MRIHHLISTVTKLYSRYSFLSPRVSSAIVNNNNYFNSFSSSAPFKSAIVNGEDDNKPTSLYERVSMADDPRVSMSTILNQWVSEGNQISSFDLQSLVSRLRHSCRYAHALQVSTWMTEKCISSLTPRDVLIQLELISRVQGLDHAEKYFSGLPESLRGPEAYITLLNCYARTRSVEKAEDLMQKMRNSGSTRHSKPYNILLKMYCESDMYDKAEQILKEMEDVGINEDTFTYRVRLVAYSKSGNVKEMDSLLMKVESDPQNTMAASDYIRAARGYLKGGVVDKSVVMMRKAEHLARGSAKKQVYEGLLTLYAHAKLKGEVYRIWGLCKRSWGGNNKAFRFMVSALVILDDLEGASKIVDEWTSELSGDISVDSSIIDPLLRAYCKKGYLERAQTHVDELTKKSCQEPRRSTLEIMVFGYCMHNQMEKAVKVLKATLVSGYPTWTLRKLVLRKCLEWVIKQGKEDDLNDFIRLLEKNGYSSESLLSDVQSSSDSLDEDDMDIVVKREN